jgi:hypothetical protein
MVRIFYDLHKGNFSVMFLLSNEVEGRSDGPSESRHRPLLHQLIAAQRHSK